MGCLQAQIIPRTVESCARMMRQRALLAYGGAPSCALLPSRCRNRLLARTSQRVAAARGQLRAMTAFRLIRVLDILHEYASALEPARALSSRPLRSLASRPVEKSGLDLFLEADFNP